MACHWSKRFKYQMPILEFYIGMNSTLIRTTKEISFESEVSVSPDEKIGNVYQIIKCWQSRLVSVALNSGGEDASS